MMTHNHDRTECAECEANYESGAQSALQLRNEDNAVDTAALASNGVRKFLDLSTAHLLPKTFDAEAPRDPAQYPGIIAHEWGEYGWWVWVPDDVDAYFVEEFIGITPPGKERSADAVPERMVAVLRYARAHGCDYILFDRDAARNPDLPVLTGVAVNPFQHEHQDA